METEEDFRKALRKNNVGGSLKKMVPIIASGISALGALMVLWLLWPMNAMPIFVLVGVPLAVGAAVFVGLERLLKLPR